MSPVKEQVSKLKEDSPSTTVFLRPLARIVNAQWRSPGKGEREGNRRAHFTCSSLSCMHILQHITKVVTSQLRREWRTDGLLADHRESPPAFPQGKDSEKGSRFPLSHSHSEPVAFNNFCQSPAHLPLSLRQRGRRCGRVDHLNNQCE
ncbi:hypothetical protein DdX_00559 [Ditylenchus destructor]|uniref:Uncharacterized protein n=1 Tax=Ditylenchus destructor TaxID=166010 RepID=A0AAD4NK41_9BILA|nr:hypothetical protein DdX_00559 [Ditylenchus destructor]